MKEKNSKRLRGSIVFFVLGSVGFALFRVFNRFFKTKDNKDRKYSQLYDNWLVIKERGDGIEKYFRENHYREIAVYGYGNIGRHVVTQLLDTDITVKYIIDRRRGVTENKIDRYCMTDQLPEVDAIVVTPICEYQEIKTELQQKKAGQIVSIEDIVYELL